MDDAIAGRLEARHLTPCIGAEIEASRESLLAGTHAQRIRDLLEQRGVLVFRGLGLSDEEQKTFTRTLGKLELQVGREFLDVTLDKNVQSGLGDAIKISFFWHIDLAHTETPCRATLLTARKLSEVGGETEFASTYAAWNELPEDEKRDYEGLKVVHNLEAPQLLVRPEPTLAELEAWRSTSPPRAQPLVWTHRSGRKSLVIGGTADYIVGKSREESRWILTRLREWATQPRFVVQHRWTLGDLVIWDNAGVMHRALPYPEDSGRHMRRTVLAGEEPVA